MSDLTTLRTVGEQLVPPPLDSLRATARLRDRRAVQVGICAASLTVLAVAGTVFATMDDQAEPAPAPPVPTETTAPSRPITYAEGDSIHYGDRTIATGGTVAELDVTDDGVAFRTADGRIWFTDGTTTDQIGELGEPIAPGPDLDRWTPRWRYGPDRSSGWIDSANSGSMLIWFEFNQTVRPDAVAYDTSSGKVVMRTEVAVPDGSWVGLQSMQSEAAYLFLDPDPFADDTLPQVRLDLATGAQTPITREDYLAEVGGHPARSFVVSHAETGFRIFEIVDGTRQQQEIRAGHLIVMGMEPLEIRDGLTDQTLDMRAPDGYPHRDRTWLVQWLDDETIVVSAEKAGLVDLLVCPVPVGVCELAMTLPAPVVLPEIG